MVMLVVAILVTAVLTMAVSAYQLATSRQEYTQALYLAEGGVNDVISTWRGNGPSNPPAQPHEGELAGGRYQVTWEPHPERDDIVIMTSQGTVNAEFWTRSIFRLTRAVQVSLDTDGDWAWNHVYYSDEDEPGMTDPLYAVINGNGDVEIDGVVGDPEDFIGHENGPMGGGTLPSPMWDIWHQWVQLDLACDPVTKEPIPRDPDGDGVADPRWVDQATLPALTTISADGDPGRHMYWYGSSAATPLDHTAHSSDSHAEYDVNFFMPDWYEQSNPDAYVCQTSNKRLTVTFGKQTAEEGVYTGNYFVHGDIHVKNHALIRGSLIATGDVTFYGVDNVSIQPEAINPNAPCEERVYYPAIIAGGNVLVRDQGKDPGNPDAERLRVSGVVWAGDSYMGQASNVQGCVVSPSVTLGGNFLVRYGAWLDGCYYEPGANPPPWFREPDRGEMQPVPRSWREVGL
jgi:hypothetical protein